MGCNAVKVANDVWQCCGINSSRCCWLRWLPKCGCLGAVAVVVFVFGAVAVVVSLCTASVVGTVPAVGNVARTAIKEFFEESSNSLPSQVGLNSHFGKVNGQSSK